MMQYKNYVGYVSYDPESDLFHGEVINIRDVVTFQGKSVRELKQALKTSIEDYLAFCAERGEEPDRPFSGKFNIRLTPDLHRDISLAARQEGMSLNNWVKHACVQKLNSA